MKNEAVLARPPLPAVLTLEEVASELRVHPNTIIPMLKSGELRGFKVGQQWRVHRTRLNEYMQVPDTCMQTAAVELEGAHL